VEADQDRGDRRDAGVGLVELVDELASVPGGEDEPETCHQEQDQPGPTPEPDGDGEQDGGDGGGDRERERFGIWSWASSSGRNSVLGLALHRDSNR
jgi:hypothetical protein